MKNRTLFNILLFLCLLCTFTACKNVTIPDDVMSKETMVDFLSEAYLLEGFYAVETGYHYDLMKPEIVASYDSLFARFGITQEDFNHSIDYYTQHPDLYQEIHQKVVDRLDEKIDQETQK